MMRTIPKGTIDIRGKPGEKQHVYFREKNGKERKVTAAGYFFRCFCCSQSGLDESGVSAYAIGDLARRLLRGAPRKKQEGYARKVLLHESLPGISSREKAAAAILAGGNISDRGAATLLWNMSNKLILKEAATLLPRIAPVLERFGLRDCTLSCFRVLASHEASEKSEVLLAFGKNDAFGRMALENIFRENSWKNAAALLEMLKADGTRQRLSAGMQNAIAARLVNIAACAPKVTGANNEIARGLEDRLVGFAMELGSSSFQGRVGRYVQREVDVALDNVREKIRPNPVIHL